MDLRAVGVPLTVEVAGCNKSLAASEIRRVWERCLRSDGMEPVATVRAVLDDDPEFIARELAAGSVAYTELAHLMHDLSPRVTDLALRMRASHAVALLHAGGVCDAAGNTVIVVGPSGAGKTTAVRRLVSHFGYVSDETIAVATDLSIAPYPKPFSVLDRGDEWKTQHAPDELGAGATPSQARAAAILVLDRQADFGPGFAVEELDMLEAMSLLAPQIAFLAGRPGPLARLAAIIDAVGPVLRVHYQEAEELRLLVADLLGMARSAPFSESHASAVRQVREDEHSPTAANGEVEAGAELASHGWRLGPVTDLLHLADGRTAVLVADQFLALSPAAGSMVRAIQAAGVDQGALPPVSRGDVVPARADWADLLSQLASVGILTTPSATEPVFP